MYLLFENRIPEFVTTLNAIISTALQMIILDKIEVNIYKAPYIKVLK